MAVLTPDDLFRLLREAGGELDGTTPAEELLDTEFTDLGYDSLALLEVSTRVEREHGVRLADDVVPELRTPRAFLEQVNAEAALR
uniref:ACP n=1 Tax=uncultured bacterium BAC-AB1442/1414/561 TaxID=1562172 RepID=A0A0C4S534_9BACT|nr:ACP [uncultured bacterium BAC-AB1442/1414/561]